MPGRNNLEPLNYSLGQPIFSRDEGSDVRQVRYRNAKSQLRQAIEERHAAEHGGHLLMCTDHVCMAWGNTEGGGW